MVQKLEDEMRNWKGALEDRIQERIPATHPIMAWLAEHVASIDRRFAVGDDGKTPIERIRGRKGKGNLIEFGEAVHYKPLRAMTRTRR